MSIHFGGSTKLSWTGQILTAYPFTLFCWIKPTSAAVTEFAMEAGASSLSDSARLYCTSSGLVRAAVLVASTANSVDASTGTDTSAWKPAMYSCASATDRKIYYSGGSVSSDTVNATPVFANFNRFVVGMAADGASLPWTGDIAEIALWSSALSGANFTTLSGDVAPETVAPGSLIESWSLLTATTLAGTVSRTLTATSATTGATHPITRGGAGVLLSQLERRGERGSFRGQL